MSSCEKAIDVNVPPYDRKLTLSSVNAMGGDPIYVLAGTTASIQDQAKNPDLAIKNAEIKLYVDGVYKETMVYDSYYGYPSNTAAEAGRKYTIKVTAPTYGEAEVSSIAPSVVAITNVARIRDIRKNEDGDMQDAIDVTFTDPATEGDHYIVRIQSPLDSGIMNFKFCVNSSDPSVETQAGGVADVNDCLDNKGIFMRDVLFNGKQKVIRFYAKSDLMQPMFDGTDSVYAKVELFHVPEAYFKYTQTATKAMDSNGDPFTEPVNVYTNVSNGFGIFAIVAWDTKEIR